MYTSLLAAVVRSIALRSVVTALPPTCHLQLPVSSKQRRSLPMTHAELARPSRKQRVRTLWIS
ncbi:MAG: hypothetical protein ACLGJA_26875, partial [Gammaproteobacteria bacterium]